jgi:hypothetical protein
MSDNGVYRALQSFSSAASLAATGAGVLVGGSVALGISSQLRHVQTTVQPRGKAAMRTLKLFTSAVLVLFCCTQAGAQKCDVVSGFRGSGFRVGYEHRELRKVFRALDEIPRNVRARLEEYLELKVGSAFRQKLRFEEGQWLDREKLKEQFPIVYEENENLGSYDLTFFFSDPEKGLRAFYSEMRLNEDGSVNSEINLPDIAFDFSRAEIISCQVAYSIAAMQGFEVEYCSARFDYSEEQKSFVWIVSDSRRAEPDNLLFQTFRGTYKSVDVNANTGAVIRAYKRTILL